MAIGGKELINEQKREIENLKNKLNDFESKNSTKTDK